ncbi:hypothetical protein IAR55_005631 [Kwoniella newhampshirensis]|uniref:Telomeric single stranded DNA binding POT1/Cdc13 domain-containing protein n=1 Tax=Kwoniella newhampshirensis TaxID=1651941 RepID=A0AAW0YFW2_9TREE
MISNSASSPAFATSTSLAPDQLVADSVIPPNTHLVGKVKMQWPNLLHSGSTIPQITFCIDSRFTLDALKPTSNPYTYVPSQGGPAVVKKYRIKLCLFHSLWTTETQASPVGEVAKKVMERMEEDSKKVEMSERELSIAVGGMKVVDVTSTGQGRYDVEVILEGNGERLLQYAGKKSIKILAEPPKPSVAPSWFDDSPPAPSVPSPVASPTSEAPARPLITASSSTSSNLRPLLSHPVPPFSRPVSKPTSTNSESVNRYKRPSTIVSDEEETGVTDTKRAKIELEKKEGSDETGGALHLENTRTVTQLGPPIGDITKPIDHPPFVAPHDSEDLVDPRPPPRLQNTPPAEESPPLIIEARGRTPSKSTRSFSEDQLQQSSDRQAEDQARKQIMLGHSQSSPSPMVAQSELDEKVRKAARRDFEARVRAQRLETEAESSRSAQARMRGVEELKRPFVIAGTKYTPLGSLISRTVVNVIGVIVDSTLPKRIATSGDMTMSVVIADPSRHAGDPAKSEEYVISIFRKTVSELPTHASIGQVILFRGLRVSIYNDKTKGNAYSSNNAIAENTWAILRSGKDLKLANSRDMQPPLQRQEVDRMVALYEWWKGEGNTVGTSDGGGVGRRVSLGLNGERMDRNFGDVGHGIFFDGTFKIMHAQYNYPRTPAYELYVADGTCNRHALRNYHNVNVGIPRSALYTIAIHDNPPEDEKRYFQQGNFVKICNLRGKLYRGELEIAWSEKPTEEQLAKGWNRRRCYLLEKSDPKAKEIEQRIEALKREEDTSDPRGVNEPIPIPAVVHQAPQPITRPDPPPTPRLATHVGTIHTNPIDHPLSTIKQILFNQLNCNKYRLHVRVKSLHARGLQENDTFIQTYCCHCKSSFKGTWCKSCNDTEGEKAEWRYRFVAILEDEGGELAVIIADDEASTFLPPLPPFDTSSNPNDVEKTKRRRKEISGQVENFLLGAKMDGERPRPVIDMTVEVYEVPKKGSEEVISVARLFGMTQKS